MNIAVPNVVKDFTAFIDGWGYGGKVDECSLPKVSIKTADHSGGGMDGDIEIDMGLDKLEASVTLSEYEARTMGLLGSGKTLTIRGSKEGPDGKVPIIAKLRGLWKEADPGSWKKGDKSTLKLTCSVRAYKLTIAADVVYDIDKAAGKRVINGEDQLLQTRINLGLI